MAQLNSGSWFNNESPRHFSCAVHGAAVVTCLTISHGRIITASDDATINVYSLVNGQLIKTLEGHEGGVWAIDVNGDTLASGSTDRTVRVWDLKTLRCTHVFRGHSSTVRSLVIVNPEMVDVRGEDGVSKKELWPKEPLLVSGSCDHTLRVWTLPKPGDEAYGCRSANDDEEDDVTANPYHRFLLGGHEHAVRDTAAKGRTVVSGSYDCTVRVWDIATGKCKWVMVGHTQKVYAVALDLSRNQAYSGSMDTDVRIWDLGTGQCVHTLTGHTSLVGLLAVSQSYLVSAAADSTIRVWDADSGDLHRTLTGHAGAITTFQHDDRKILSGSDGVLKLWDIRDGRFVRDLLTEAISIWRVVFKGRWCVVASNKGDGANGNVLDVWDFGQGDNAAGETDGDNVG